MIYTTKIRLPESIEFYGDPLCPWTYKSYKFIKLGCNDLKIRFKYVPLSLKIINSNRSIDKKIQEKLESSFHILETLAHLNLNGYEELSKLVYESICVLIHDENREITPDLLKDILSSLNYSSVDEVAKAINDNKSQIYNYLVDTYDSIKVTVGEDSGSPVVLLQPENIGFFGPIITDNTFNSNNLDDIQTNETAMADIKSNDSDIKHSDKQSDSALINKGAKYNTSSALTPKEFLIHFINIARTPYLSEIKRKR
jgi:hypothetical protein